jgi:hypothetical protein
MQVPEIFRERYIDISFKHQDTISSDKYDLGLARNYWRKIHLKKEDPVYHKQFKIPEAHHQFIEQTLEEWLKLGGSPEIGLIVQLPHILHTKETRTRTLDCARLQRAKPDLPHRQIFHEEDHRMPQRHWTGQFQNLLHFGSHFWILSNETEHHGIHDSRQGTIPLDHVTNGTTGVSGKFSTSHGRSTLKPPERDHLHQ